MKKLFRRCLAVLLCVLALTGLKPVNAMADIMDTSKPFISLGADLSEEQRGVVLSLLGLTEADLAGYNVTYVTNDMEKAYLGGYLDPEVIGNTALSSVKVVGREAGYGLHVSTYNINYCTAGMYENALVTAGVRDADVFVAGPCEISGTAALIGIMQAYAQMTGQVLDAESMDAATNELVATGVIADAIGDSAVAEELMAVIKDAVVNQGIKDTQSLRELILKYAQEYGVVLSDADVELIVQLMVKISELDIDPETMAQIEELCKELEDLDITEEDLEEFWEEFGDFFIRLWNELIAWVEDLFGV